MKKTKWPGEWKVVCDVCGFQYPSSEIKERWDGAIVCHKDWETRQPQTLIRLVGKEDVAPPFVRPEPPDVFRHFCSIESVSCYSDLAQADCALANNQQYTYLFLYELTVGSI